VGWHELLAADWEKAFAFYAELFGWQKTDSHLGAMGAYQGFSAGGEPIGGMFTKPATLPLPFWLYYFNVDDIEAAAKRVQTGGGQILYGPSAGRPLIVHCGDPRAPFSRCWTGEGAKRVSGRIPISTRPARSRSQRQRREGARKKVEGGTGALRQFRSFPTNGPGRVPRA
jgi:predicted enzyme related to lactoylglutathione lyase